MATRFRDMIQAVRDICLEYDERPFDDDYIVRKLQFGVNYVYNHYVKANETMYHDYFYFNLQPDRLEYDMPKQTFGQRVERLELPNPPEYGIEPFRWQEIEKRTPREVARLDVPSTSVLLPYVWAQRGRKVMLAPRPQTGMIARLVWAKRLPPVARDEGAITSIDGDIIRLDDAPSENAHDVLQIEGGNLLSVTCGETGLLKKVYPFEQINGLEIKLTSTSRDKISSFPVTSIVSANIYSVAYDAISNTLDLNSDKPITGIRAGDFIELSYGLQEGRGYNIVDVLTDDDDFYDPPEFTAPANPFPELATVIHVAGSSLTVKVDGSYSPSLDNGYKLPYSATNGNVIGASSAIFSGRNVIEVEFDAPHGFENGKVYKVTCTGTGITELDGLRNKCYRVNDTKIAVLRSTFTGIFTPGGVWTSYQYPVVPDTGIPSLTEVALANPEAVIVTAFKNSPKSYRLYPSKTTIDPDVYDPVNNIEIDDVVSIGYSIGACPLPSAYEEAIVLWAALPMRSSMNESDSMGVALLKELMAELKGDNAGRLVGTTITREWARRGRVRNSRRSSR